MVSQRIVLVACAALLVGLAACDSQSTQSDRQPAPGGDSDRESAERPRQAALDWFADLTLDEAGQRAQAEDKTVFVAVHTRGCRACGSVDRDVLSHPDVQALLTRHTVPIRVNLSGNLPLAARYRIMGTPTLLFLRPDGSEIERILGKVSRETFLALAKDYARGSDRADLALEEVVWAHYRLASVLADKKRFSEALQQYKWTLEGGAKSPQLSEKITPYVLDDLVWLGEQYSPARQELEQRCRAARERLTSGDRSKIDLLLVSRVNRRHQRLGDTLELYDLIRPGVDDPAWLADCTKAALDALLEAHRYDDVAAGLSIEQAVDLLFDQARESQPQSADYSAKKDWEQADALHKGPLRWAVCGYYQALIGLERHQEAERVAQRLLDVAPGALTLNSLAWAGYLTGHPTEANLEQARAAYAAPRGDNAAIVDTLARVLAARGHRDEALALLRGCLKEGLYDAGDRAILKQCGADLKAGR